MINRGEKHNSVSILLNMYLVFIAFTTSVKNATEIISATMIILMT